MAEVIKKRKTDVDPDAAAVTEAETTSPPAPRKLPAAATASDNGDEISMSEPCDHGDDDDGEEVTEKTEGASGGGRLLREGDVGITEYISQHQGFSGVLKQRFSDFLVNEVGLDTEVVRLTDTSRPACDVTEPVKGPSAEELLSQVLTETQVEALRALASGKDHKAEVEIEAGDDKAHRSRVHEAIREGFPVLESKTEATPTGSKVIKVNLPDRKNCRDKRLLRRYWPADRGDYCHFVLYKENKDTIDAVNLLAKLTRMRPGLFMYAGTKDKRAKTSQMISIHRVSASRLHNLNRHLKGLKLGNFKYCSFPLKLGDHKGNRFAITLRNVTGTSAQIESALESLRTVGFINYYGMQRFGTMSVPTHHVGRAILKSQWQEAVDLILQPREGDHQLVADARKVWLRQHDAKAALVHLGNRHCVERHLWQGLLRCDSNDLVNALANIPRYSRLMYLHAYQSYVWNTVVSRRVQQYGLQPIVGDLVFSSRDMPQTEGPASDQEDHTKKDNTAPTRAPHREPMVVTPDNLHSYHITDVVLPLPGHMIRLPETESVRNWYTEILEEDGMTMDTFHHKVRDYSLTGDYRYVIIRPHNTTHEVLHYDDVTHALVLSDLDRLRGQELPEPCTDGKFTALKVEFTLPPSTYATMAIREILKQDTSPAHQTSLNVT